MRWEAWPLVALYVFGIISTAADIGKPRKPLTAPVAKAVIGVSLVLIWLSLRLGGAL